MKTTITVENVNLELLSDQVTSLRGVITTLETINANSTTLKHLEGIIELLNSILCNEGF